MSSRNTVTKSAFTAVEKTGQVPDISSHVETLHIHTSPSAIRVKKDKEEPRLHHNHHLLHKYNSSGSDDADSDSDDACCPRSPVTFGPSPTVGNEHGLSRLLKNNRAWSKAIRERNPEFFEKGSKGQQPKVFWIGCSDSRVPENELLQLGKRTMWGLDQSVCCLWVALGI